MADLMGGALGPEAKWKIDLAAGRVIFKAAYEGLGGGAELLVSLKSDYLIDELANKIPGKLDDAVLSVLKAALAAV